MEPIEPIFKDDNLMLKLNVVQNCVSGCNAKSPVTKACCIVASVSG